MLNTQRPSRLDLFPITARIEQERLTVDGQDLATLAQIHGTPLYLYDQASMDQAVAEYRAALAQGYPGQSGITYAGKAFLCVAVAQWAAGQGLWIDCTGEGELAIAQRADVPRAQILVHGVNKSPADLAAAVALAGTIVVDNLSELIRLTSLHEDTQREGRPFPDLWLRMRPGLSVETHSYRQTGQEESKFGMSREELAQAVGMAQARGLPLTGLHFHQGSHFHDPAPLGPALERALDLIALLAQETGWQPQVLCPGGGWGVAYHEDELPHPAIHTYVDYIAQALIHGCQRRGLPLPRLQVEPGRSLVARAGVALYRVGTVKQSGARRWLLLDGGMADNIRPALYGSRYSALPVMGPTREAIGPAWLAGPYCESGDVLMEDLPMPGIEEGEILAVPVSGAYHLMMGSNYNGARRPAVLWLHRGEATLIQERESLADLVRRG